MLTSAVAEPESYLWVTVFGKAFMRNVWIFAVAAACAYASPAFAVAICDPSCGGGGISSGHATPPTIVLGGPYTIANDLSGGNNSFIIDASGSNSSVGRSFVLTSDDGFVGVGNVFTVPQDFYHQLGTLSLHFAAIDSSNAISHAATSVTFVLGVSNTVSGVPEPATWAMMLIGLGGIGLAMRRKHAPLLAHIV